MMSPSTGTMIGQGQVDAKAPSGALLARPRTRKGKAEDRHRTPEELRRGAAQRAPSVGVRRSFFRCARSLNS